MTVKGLLLLITSQYVKHGAEQSISYFALTVGPQGFDYHTQAWLDYENGMFKNISATHSQMTFSKGTNVSPLEEEMSR